MSHSPPARDAVREPCDAQLASQALQGCAASFEELVRRHQVSLLGYLRLRSRTQHDAEDAVQDAFLRAYQKLHLYKSKYPFKVWLFTIARRQMINRLRRVNLESSSGDVEVADDQLSADQKFELKENRDRLWHAAQQLLSETQFTTLWLHYGEGMSTKEIGQVLGHSRPRVKTALFRARNLLKQQLCPDRVNGKEAEPERRPNKILSPLAAEISHA